MSVFKDLIPDSLQRGAAPFLHHIDSTPLATTTPGLLSGWALEGRGSVPVVVVVGGETVVEMPPLFPRHDVQRQFERLSAPLFSGFEVRFPLRDLQAVPPGQVVVAAKTARGLKTIWEWPGAGASVAGDPGARAGSDDALQRLKRELPRLNQVPEAKRDSAPKDVAVHIVLETAGRAPSLTRALDQLEAMFSDARARPASLTVLNAGSKPIEDITRIAATAGAARRSGLSVHHIGKSPSWRSLRRASDDEVRNFVFFARDDVDLSSVSLAGLLAAYRSLPYESIVQPTPYGGRGASFAPGASFTEIASAAKACRKDVPALAACENPGLVWLAPLGFLEQFDRGKNAVSGHEFAWPLARPPAGKFVYYLDLRQPVAYPSGTEVFADPHERWRVEQALVNSLVPPKNSGKSSVVPFFISADWAGACQESGRLYQVRALADQLEQEGAQVVFVVDDDSAETPPISGRAPFRFSDFTLAAPALNIEWCVATDWFSLKAANTARLLCGASVCMFYQTAEHLRIGSDQPENELNACWASRGFFTPITTSRWIKEHLVEENAAFDNAELLRPALNREFFRSLPVERRSKSVLFMLDSRISSAEAKFVEQTIEELRARHATVWITAVISGRKSSRLKAAAEKCDAVVFDPDGAELAELFAGTEIACVPGNICGFDPALLEAAACGALVVVTDAAAVQTLRPEAFPAVISRRKGEHLAGDLHDLLWNTSRAAEQREKLNAWLERLAGTGATTPLTTALKKAEAQTLRRLAAEQQGGRPLSIIVPVRGAIDHAAMCIRSLLVHAPQDAELIVVNDGSPTGASNILRQFAAAYSGRLRLVELNDSLGFVGSCAAALEHRRLNGDILILHSDAILTRDCVSRLKSAVYSRPLIAAASPLSTSANLLQLNINSGESFEQAATVLGHVSDRQRPVIPGLESYAMYIKGWALERFDFFDERFGPGFFEAADYGMRLLLNGADIVCADDALVHHHGAASFTPEERRRQLRRNQPLFDARWSRYYKPLLDRFLEQDLLGGTRLTYGSAAPQLAAPVEPFSLTKEQKRFLEGDSLPADLSPGAAVLGGCKVVFLLPGAILGGGSISVIQHANELILRGIEARVISLGPIAVGDYPCLAPIISVSLEQLFALDWDRQTVVGTFWTTAYIVASLKRKFRGLQGFYYVQDYEPWFYAHSEEFPRVQEAKASYELGLQCVAKTQFLCDLVAREHNVSVELVSPGLDHSVFYPGDQQLRRGRPRLAGMLRLGTARRGGREMIELLRILRRRLPELEVTLFGDPSGLPSDLDGHVQMLGPIAPRFVAELYRSADIVVDLSYWHGFGRSGIEGMACGAVPVVSASGGIERYAEDGKNSFVVDAEDLQSVADRVIELAVKRELRMQMRSAGLISVRRFSETLAIDDWLTIIGAAAEIRRADDPFGTREAASPPEKGKSALRALS